jgi:hypothetical protein
VADYQLTHTPIEVVPDAGCRTYVVSVGGEAFYGRSHVLEPATIVGSLSHDERVTIDERMWFMSGDGARLHVVQQRFCRRCGWVDG